MVRSPSAASIGRVAVRRNQQGHVVMVLLGADAEAQHYHVEEGRFGKLYATRAVVIACTELQLVNAGAVLVAFQQGRIAAAVGIGLPAGDQLQASALDAIKLDLGAAARTAVGGVQHLSSQTSRRFPALQRSRSAGACLLLSMLWVCREHSMRTAT